MNKATRFKFEIYIMDLCEIEKCKTAEDYSRLAELLHESIENAICDMCMDNGIQDYVPSY